MEMIAQGAESCVYRIKKWGKTLAMKSRPEKGYLLPEIDKSIRSRRTSRECKMLTYVRQLGVPTPAVYSIDKANHSIIMDYIEGKQLKELVANLPKRKLVVLCREFGHYIGIMHSANVVHGDPTTSNVIMDSVSKMWFIDFGLAEKNATIEMKGVDLHLIQRALETTHWDCQNLMFEAVLEGYTQTVGFQSAQILSRMNSIRERGRYH
jgi:TP53 regulating kinase and related kinases